MDVSFYDEAIENGEEVEFFEFFYNEQCAFANDGKPAVLTIINYEGKYIVSIDGDSENSEEVYSLPEDFYDRTIYETYAEAKQHCLEILSMGIKPGKEQIAECISQVTDSDHVFIESYKQLYGVDFNVYYNGQLLVEHMRGLYPEVINEAIQIYKNFTHKYGIKISDIYKERKEWNSNQRYYRIEFVDNTGTEESYRVHIPSAMQGIQRCTLSCVKDEQFEAFLKEKGILWSKTRRSG